MALVESSEVWVGWHHPEAKHNERLQRLFDENGQSSVGLMIHNEGSSTIHGLAIVWTNESGTLSIEPGFVEAGSAERGIIEIGALPPATDIGQLNGTLTLRLMLDEDPSGVFYFSIYVFFVNENKTLSYATTDFSFEATGVNSVGGPGPGLIVLGLLGTIVINARLRNVQRWKSWGDSDGESRRDTLE